MSFLRFFMLLSLVVWIGGILFFGAVVAPALFSVLPTRQLAGSVVSRVLANLHWIGIISGLIYLMTSMIYARLALGSAHPLAARHVLIVVMIGLTLISQFAISARMNALRTDMGQIDSLPQNDPRRIEFDSLHHWSTRLETAVLVLGLGAIYLTARRLP